MVRDGLYVVDFRSAGDEGAGTVVVRDGSVNGGDFGYVYQGRLNEDGQQLTSSLVVLKFNPRAQSIFGPADRYELELSGSTNGDEFELSGNVRENPSHRIQINGRFFRELV